MNAPICLFVYKRVETTKLVLESLRRCPECVDSEIYVFLDEARNDDEASQVEEVRDLFEDLQGFKEVHLYPARMNKGMARSVIEGVTLVLNEHDSIIVLEDDIVVAPDFLSFMNSALDTYKNRNDIWSISGYTPKLGKINNNSGVFLAPRAQSWGWATWSDRWESVDWEVSDFKDLARSKRRRSEFDRGGNDLFRTLEMEQNQRLESWSIRWAYSASKQNMWTVYPMQSKTQNIGLKSSVSHVAWHDEQHAVELLGNNSVIDPEVSANDKIVRIFKKHHDLSFVSKIGYFMRLHNLGYDFFKKLFHRD